MKINNNIEITNEDNMLLMARYPDNYFDLAIVDPPYGIDIANWDKEIPNDEYFTELFRVSKNQIIWGGNYFDLPTQRGWVCWDKSVVKAGYLGKREFDEFELAWTSFDCKCKMVRFSDIGNMSGFDGKIKIDYTMKAKIHPTQKHINLYSWLLKQFAEPNQKILDTHLGSGSIAIAVDNANKMDKMNLTLTACELDKGYFENATNRIKEQTNWTSVF
jgi:site-specific DNA-methyltransferase (adenine-specific)